VVDVVAISTDSLNPRDYWFKMKKREKGFGVEISTNCRRLKKDSSDWKKYSTDCSTTEGAM